MTTYQLPKPVGYSGFGPRYNTDQIQAAFTAGAASRDSEVEALKQELHEGDDLRERLSDILTRSVNMIRGEPEPLHLHSWHDLPELIEALRAALTLIAELHPDKDSDEGYNEWGEADCFNQAQEIARAAMGDTP